MSDTIKKVDLKDVGNYNKAIDSKKYNMNYINNSVDNFDFDLAGNQSQPTGTDINGGIKLDGKYVDESGKTFDAKYYYSTDGTYNVNYTDAFKNITIKFQVDGTKMNSETTYKDPATKEIVKEIIKYSPNGDTEKEIYNGNNLASKEVTNKEGTTTYTYDGKNLTREKIVRLDGSSKETIYNNPNNKEKTEIEIDTNGNKQISKYDFEGEKYEEEIKNSSGTTTEKREYTSYGLGKVKLYNEQGEQTEERSYRNGLISNIKLQDGRKFDYDDQGNLASVKVGDDLQIRYANGKIVSINGNNDINIMYNDEGGIYNVNFGDEDAKKANIKFNIEKNKYASPDTQKSSGVTTHSGTVKQIVFNKDAAGYPSNLIISTGGEIINATSRIDDINIDVDGLNNYLSSFEGYADGYKNVN